MDMQSKKEKLLYIISVTLFVIYIATMFCIEIAYCDELPEVPENTEQFNSEQPQESQQVQASVTPTEQPTENKEESNTEKTEYIAIDYTDKLNSIKDNTYDIKEVLEDVQNCFSDKKDNDNDFEVTMVGIVGNMADNVGDTVSSIDSIKRCIEDMALSENTAQVILSANDFKDIRLLINDENIINAISENKSSYIESISENGRLLSVNSVLFKELIKAQSETNNLLYALGIAMIFVIGIQLGEMIIRSLPKG